MMRHGLSLTASLKSNGIIGSEVNLESAFGIQIFTAKAQRSQRER
jgi:hypothetical protein